MTRTTRKKADNHQLPKRQVRMFRGRVLLNSMGVAPVINPQRYPRMHPALY